MSFDSKQRKAKSWAATAKVDDRYCKSNTFPERKKRENKINRMEKRNMLRRLILEEEA